MPDVSQDGDIFEFLENCYQSFLDIIDALEPRHIRTVLIRTKEVNSVRAAWFSYSQAILRWRTILLYLSPFLVEQVEAVRWYGHKFYIHGCHAMDDPVLIQKEPYWAAVLLSTLYSELPRLELDEEIDQNVLRAVRTGLEERLLFLYHELFKKATAKNNRNIHRKEVKESDELSWFMDWYLGQFTESVVVSSQESSKLLSPDDETKQRSQDLALFQSRRRVIADREPCWLKDPGHITGLSVSPSASMSRYDEPIMNPHCACMLQADFLPYALISFFGIDRKTMCKHLRHIDIGEFPTRDDWAIEIRCVIGCIGLRSMMCVLSRRLESIEEKNLLEVEERRQRVIPLLLGSISHIALCYLSFMSECEKINVHGGILRELSHHMIDLTATPHLQKMMAWNLDSIEL